MIIISNNGFLKELNDLGYVISESVTNSVAFLNSLNLSDADKLFLYQEFKSEIEAFKGILQEKLKARDFAFLEDKAHELKGVSKNLKFDDLSDVLYKMQLSSEEKDSEAFKLSASEFEGSIDKLFL